LQGSTKGREEGRRGSVLLSERISRLRKLENPKEETPQATIALPKK
jgi:hypothetical protein